MVTAIMQVFTTKHKAISIFSCAGLECPVLYLNTFSSEGQKIFEAAQAAGCPPFTLVAISDLDWNHDMVPWDSPPAFKNADPCTGGADDYLRLLTEEIIPTAEKKITGVPRWRGIAGYSLAGLFALYSIYQTDLFSRVGSMFGFLWFPGMKGYIFSHEPKRRPDCMYFSLGDMESETRNTVLQSVQQNTEELQMFYQARGIDTVIQLNPVNYHNHTTKHIVTGIYRILRAQFQCFSYCIFQRRDNLINTYSIYCR